MKKIITLGLITILFGCVVDKEILSQYECTKWHSKNDTIYYTNKPIAVYDHVEYELNPSHGKGAKPIVEISITQIGFGVETDNLIKYVHTMHSKQKVEIVVPRH